MSQLHFDAGFALAPRSSSVWCATTVQELDVVLNVMRLPRRSTMLTRCCQQDSVAGLNGDEDDDLEGEANSASRRRIINIAKLMIDWYPR
jgi:hypothetical protein